MNLRPETEKRIADLVAAGRFQSADEFVDVALEIVKDNDTLTDRFVEENREYLEGALEAAQAEPARPMTEADWDNLRDRVDARANSHPKT